jgi:subtilisin family serine protease
MRAYNLTSTDKPGSYPKRREQPPSEELRVAITFPSPKAGVGLTKFPAPLSSAIVGQFAPDPLQMERAIHELSRVGFRPTRRGRLSASMRVDRMVYEKHFGTELSAIQLDPRLDYAFHSFYFPKQGAPWKPSAMVRQLIDDAYVQWPHIYMATPGAGQPATPSGTPPVIPYFHLEMPNDVPALLNAKPIHEQGGSGKGIRIAMVDTGFAHNSHPFFANNGFKSTVDLAPHAIDDSTDVNGHGTGESANLFAVAPGATFIGIKLDNDNDPQSSASFLEGFQTALQHQPHIISMSIGFDLRDELGQQQSELPNSLAALEAEVQAAIAAGIVVVFSAGNGHFSFPGMMPEVISAGGVFVDQNGNLQASDYASAFASKIFPGRHVPDFCGLVGLLPHANYIMLPVPPGSQADVESAQPPDGGDDGTRADDGWAVFSGTSSAAPQLAGVCALLLEKNNSLTPSDIKAVLRRTARTVVKGHANPDSSDNGIGLPASQSDTGAAGAGLVDAFAAWQQV